MWCECICEWHGRFETAQQSCSIVIAVLKMKMGVCNYKALKWALIRGWEVKGLPNSPWQRSLMLVQWGTMNREDNTILWQLPETKTFSWKLDYLFPTNKLISLQSFPQPSRRCANIDTGRFHIPTLLWKVLTASVIPSSSSIQGNLQSKLKSHLSCLPWCVSSWQAGDIWGHRADLLLKNV